MTSKTKLSAQLLSQAITRRCPATCPPQLQQSAAQQQRRARHYLLRRSSRLSSSQVESCHSRASQYYFQPTKSIASSWHRPQQQQRQQHRYFTESTAESDEPRTLAYDANEYSTSESSSGANRSLHSQIHKILTRERLSNENLRKARAFLSIASKWHNEQGATLSEALLERLHKEQLNSEGNETVGIDAEMYNICMNAWNKSNVDGERIVSRVQSIMDRMEERYSRSIDDDDGSGRGRHTLTPRPDKYSYNCLINAHSKWEDEDSSEKLEGILQKMNALADDAASSYESIDRGYDILVRPDAFTYNSLMNYYATRRNEHLSAQRAEDILLQMSELSQRGGSSKGGGSSSGQTVEMSTTSFNIVLKAWGNSGSGIHGAQRAESVLQMMIKLYGRGHENVRPNAVSFSTVISAYSKVDPEDASVAVDRVMELLDEMEGSYFPKSDAGVNTCYNAAANVIVKSGVDDALDRVKELMNRMKNMDAAPDSNMYASMIEAAASEGSDGSFSRAKEILQEMVEGLELESTPVVPFNILLNSTLKGNSTNKLNKAQEIMTMMENIGGNARPDLSSYSMIISALSRNTDDDKGSEQKALDYLRSMLKSYRQGYQPAKPNSFIFNCIISMLARSNQDWADDVIYKTLMAMENQQKKGNTLVVPDVITYNLVIGKLAQTGTKENAKKVMKILSTMEESSRTNEAIAPDIITYTNVLRLQEKVRSPRAAYIASSCLERAMSSGKEMQVDRLGFQTLLVALSRSDKLEHAAMARKAWEWMEKTDKKAKKNVLDSRLCNLVLIAYGRSTDMKAAEEALAFLSKRVGRYDKGDKATILPTMIGFDAALGCLGKANKIDDALRLLKIMKALAREGMPNVAPDERCYASILGALANSRAENASSQALRMVKLIKEDLGQIPTAALNAAISTTCSRTTGAGGLKQRKAVEIAFELFQLDKDNRDAVTFGLMIRTCMVTQNSDDARMKLIEPLFKLCAKSGLVGNMVIREVKHLKKRLIIDDQIPIEWSMNAKDR